MPLIACERLQIVPNVNNTIRSLIRGVRSTGSEGCFVFRGCHRATSMVRHHPYRQSFVYSEAGCRSRLRALAAGAGQPVPRGGGNDNLT